MISESLTCFPAYLPHIMFSGLAYEGEWVVYQMVVQRSLARFRRLAAAETAPPPGSLGFPASSSIPSSISPSLSLSLSPAQPVCLSRFLRQHLKPHFSPSDLLRFLRGKLRHHPALAAYDLFVFRWAAGVDSFRHDHSTFEWMIRTLCVTDRMDDLRDVLGFMMSNPCPCNGDGIFACSRVEPIYRFVVNAMCRVGRVDQAEAAFEDLKRSIDGKPGIVSYNILMSGFCKIGRHEKVREVYRRIGRDRVKPDGITFNIMINSLCRSGGFDSVPDLFKEMKANGCNPNLISFNTLIVGFLRRGKIAEGINVAREMFDLGYKFSAATCEILIRGICREAKASEACDLIIEFLTKGAVPEDLDCLDLVQDLCTEGEIDKAVDLVNLLPQPGAVTYAAMIDTMTKYGRIDDAICLTEKMIEGAAAPLDVITFNGLLRGLCRRGRAAEAEKLLAAARSGGFLPDCSSFEIVAGGLAREGRRKEGEEVVNSMVDAGFIGNVHDYNRLMKRMDYRSTPGPKTAH